MIKLGKELEFISNINRDGKGVVLVGTSWNKNCNYPKTYDMSYLDDTKFKLTCLSIIQDTYIAIGVNSWVVKIKNQKPFKF